MKLSVPALVLVLSTFGAAELKQVEWDCSKTPESCNNACYAVACRDKKWTLTFNGGDRAENEKLSGKAALPCASGYAKYADEGHTYARQGDAYIVADEYPFASSREGGTGAVLRCTTKPDSDSQGGIITGFWSGLSDGDQIHITPININLQGSPHCAPYAKGEGSGAVAATCENRAKYEFHLVHPPRQGVKNEFAAADPIGKTKRDSMTESVAAGRREVFVA